VDRDQQQHGARCGERYGGGRREQPRRRGALDGGLGRSPVGGRLAVNPGLVGDRGLIVEEQHDRLWWAAAEHGPCSSRRFPALDVARPRRERYRGGMDSLAGQLLIAAPTLHDPNFRRTVVLIAAHSEDGALGFVLNRPTDAVVSDVVDELAAITDGDEVIHVGGPVAPGGVIVLGEFDDPGLVGVQIDGDLGLPASDADLEQLGAGVRRARVFAGHAGWGPGQLEAELEQEDWIVAPMASDDLFEEPSDGLWEQLLERMGGAYALVARMPLDPSMN